MSRSANDATRFTPNTPHTYSRDPAATAGSRSTKTPFQSSHPSASSTSAPRAPTRSETAHEKVARLRAEHIKRRAAQLSTWDRLILRGRSMADAAHRWTIFGILTFSVLAGGLTVFSAVDMIAYNRRKKKEFYKEYQKLWEQRHADALQAQVAGTATETQLTIIKQEEDAQKFHQQRQEGAWQRIKGFFSYKGLSNEDLGAQSWEQRKELMDQSEPRSVAPSGTAESDILQAVEQSRASAVGQTQGRKMEGGQLDRLAANIAGATTAHGSQRSSWFSFGGRGS